MEAFFQYTTLHKSHKVQGSRLQSVSQVVGPFTKPPGRQYGAIAPLAQQGGCAEATLVTNWHCIMLAVGGESWLMFAFLIC